MGVCSRIALFVAVGLLAVASHGVAQPVGVSALVQMTITVTDLPGAEADCVEDGGVCVPPGALTIATEPWSEVFADGQLIGTTPLWRHRLLPGRYSVRMANSDAGFEIERDIEVPSARMVKVRAHFAAVAPLPESSRDDIQLARDCGRDLLTPAYLSVNTTPWTQVWIDGKLAGSTPLYRHRVAPGLHQIRLINPRDRAELRRTIQVREGDAVKIVPAAPVVAAPHLELAQIPADPTGRSD